MECDSFYKPFAHSGVYCHGSDEVTDCVLRKRSERGLGQSSGRYQHLGAQQTERRQNRNLRDYGPLQKKTRGMWSVANHTKQTVLRRTDKTSCPNSAENLGKIQ